MNDYSGPVAVRDSSELVGAMRPYLLPGASVLDLGCGPRDQAPVFEYLQCRYVGVDYASPNSDILADAHSLPFKRESFDVIFSYAVLEHLYNPFVAISEIARTLKPGGIYCGTVSQGEPFHDSFFHHTAWGMIGLVESSDLRIKRLWSGRDTLLALSTMGKYPRVIRTLLSSVSKLHDYLPFLSPRKAFRWSAQDKFLDELFRAGSLCFLMQKETRSE